MIRILVTGAGGAAGSNFIRCLRLASECFYVVGTDCHAHRLYAADAEAHYLVPRSSQSGYIAALNHIIARENVQLVHPQPDAEVAVLSEERDRIKARMWLPERVTVRTLQDKQRAAAVWYDRGLHSAKTFLVQSKDDLARACEELGLPLWLRARSGAGARASAPIRSLEAGHRWLGFWNAHSSSTEFIAQQYLPGREYAFPSIWQNGELVTSLLYERLSYLQAHLTPSGKTGAASELATRHGGRVNEAAVEAVRAVDSDADGLFCVDLTEDANGRPVPTEINCGRFFTSCVFWARAGANLPLHYVRLALGLKPEPLPAFNAAPPGKVWLRRLDAESQLIDEEALDMRLKSSRISR
jgi:carbamoyl-phosphate synthase large subunit